MTFKKKQINKFYRDYKKIHEFIDMNSKLSKQEIAKLINYEIVKKFLDSEGISQNTSLHKLLTFEEPDIEYDLFLSNIQNIVYKYSWSLNDNRSDLTPDVIGKVFEKYINQRENGAYYTDEDIIHYILDSAVLWSIINKLDPDNEIRIQFLHMFNNTMIEQEDKLGIFEQLVKTAVKTDIEEVLKVLREFKLADISVGTGAFIVSALEYLVIVYRICYENLEIHFNIQNIVTHIIENTIYGIDIMEDALDIAKFRVIIKSIQILKKYDKELIRIPKLNFYHENSLTFSNWEDIVGNSKSKFHCIVGNPPYVEYSKVSDYTITGFKTLKSGNLYSYMIERSIDLLDQDGVMGIVVPISLVSTLRMSHTRNYIYEHSSKIFISNFSDRPGTLFNGVHQKLSIVIANKDSQESLDLYTTRYIHWYENERIGLFNNIEYTLNNFRENDFIYKVGNLTEKEILKKLIYNDSSILDLLDKDGSYPLSMSNRMTFWIKTFLNVQESSEYKKLYFKEEKIRNFVYLLLNSDIFFFYWETISDGWHITSKELQNFRINIDDLDKYCSSDIKELTMLLDKDIERNKEYIGTKQTDYSYKHKLSKDIIDRINVYLKNLFDLTEYELDYIRSYNLSYRMNDEYDNYLERRGEI